MRTLRRAAVVLVVAMLLVGCRGSGKSSSPTTTEAPTTTTTLSQIELDKAKAKRVVLTAPDLPGFSVDPPDPSDDDTEIEADACANNNLLLARIGEDNDLRGAQSEDFAKGDEVGVSSAVTFAETEDEARAAITALMAVSLPTCVSRIFTNELRENVAFTNVSVNTTRLPAVTVGDQSVGYRSVARFRAGGRSMVVNVDFTFVRVGRGLALLNAFSANTAFAEGERGRLLTLLAGRLAAP